LSNANEDLRDRASTDQAQPSRRMTWSMTLDPRLGQDPPLASASEPIIPKRITRSRAQAMKAEHQLVSLFLISLEQGPFSIIGGVFISLACV